MAVKPRLRLSTGQRLALTPGMRQSLWLLRLPVQELREEIARLADENPFIELGEVSARAMPAPEMEPAAVPSALLSIVEQIGALRLEPSVREAALTLAAELREDGYLDTDLAEIAESTGIAPETLAKGLAALQSCEPAGIGARDLPECLALQLAARGIAPDTARRAAACLDDFAEGRWRRLAARLDLPQGDVERIAAILPNLPAAPLEPGEEPAQPRVPDLIIGLDPDGRPSVAINPDALPSVTAHPAIPGASAEAAAAREQAAFLAAALRARVRTLLKIGAHVATRQAGHFSSRGTEPLRPETRAEAALALAMHPSTLGRAIAGKSLAAHGGVFNMETFFSHSIGDQSLGISAHAVQRRIRALIAAEPPEAPLADEAICAQLRIEGVDIARRTVAKYRKCMRIASSHARRRRRLSGRDRGAPARTVFPPEQQG